MVDIYQFLSEHRINYNRHDHPPVYTVADTKRLVPELPGAGVKNLFLRNPKGNRHFLVVAGADQPVDLKGLAGVLGLSRISFASPERLLKHLGVEPGAVTLLAVANDREHKVEVVIDADLWQSEAFQFHPLVNTATLVIKKADLEAFLNATGHHIKVAALPPPA